jgi:hypothetical protein
MEQATHGAAPTIQIINIYHENQLSISINTFKVAHRKTMQILFIYYDNR